MLALQTNKQTRYKGIVCLQEVRNVNNIQISLGRGWLAAFLHACMSTPVHHTRVRYNNHLKLSAEFYLYSFNIFWGICNFITHFFLQKVFITDMCNTNITYVIIYSLYKRTFSVVLGREQLYVMSPWNTEAHIFIFIHKQFLLPVAMNNIEFLCDTNKTFTQKKNACKQSKVV